MKKILHILVQGELGGAQKIVIQLIDAMKTRYHFNYASMSGAVTPVLEENEIPFSSYQRKTVHEIRKIIKRVQPDIIHAHDFIASVLCAIAVTNVPIISHLHCNPLWNQKLCVRTLLYYLASKRFQIILTVSNSVMKEAYFGKSLMQKTVMVGNPFDASKVLQGSKENDTCISSDILFLGRFHSSKNPMRFIEIISQLVQVRPDVKCLMIGAGELKCDILAEIHKSGLENNVWVLDFQRNPYVFLNNTKMLCIPSQFEGFGLTALEAMTLGIPVIASPVGGLNDIVDDSCGRLCVTNDEFIQEMNRLLNDRDYYCLKSQNAVQKSKVRDNFLEYIQFMMSIYESIGEKK